MAVVSVKRSIVRPLNEHIVYFREPILKPDYIRLISCSLYNSWHNLKHTGEISIFSYDNTAKVEKLLKAHYDVKTMAAELSNIFEKNDNVKVKTNTPAGSIGICSVVTSVNHTSTRSEKELPLLL